MIILVYCDYFYHIFSSDRRTQTHARGLIQHILEQNHQMSSLRLGRGMGRIISISGLSRWLWLKVDMVTEGRTQLWTEANDSVIIHYACMMTSALEYYSPAGFMYREQKNVI